MPPRPWRERASTINVDLSGQSAQPAEVGREELNLEVIVLAEDAISGVQAEEGEEDVDALGDA
jgi:hypothetical protein